MIVEFTLDHPDVEKINADRRKDAHAELKRWLGGRPPLEQHLSMRGSTERILTTHVGSLPRSQAVTDVLFAPRTRRDRATSAAAAAVITDAVAEVVRRQVETGVDVVSDGETNKISYATYIADRFAGFGGDTPREPGQDLVEFPRFMAKLAASGATAKYRRPRCVGEIALQGRRAAARRTSATSAAAVDAAQPAEAFMNAASPGVLALFQPNDYYPSAGRLPRGARRGDAARSTRPSSAPGFLLQIDAPDLGMGRHTMYRNASVDEYLKAAARHVEVLNHALRNMPGRPHAHAHLLGQLRGPAPPRRPARAAAAGRDQGEAAGAAVRGRESAPRARVGRVHATAACRTTRSWCRACSARRRTTSSIRSSSPSASCRFADIVGRERVIAGTDCGFGTFGGFGPVDPDIVYLKLGSLAEGARIASERLWSATDYGMTGSSIADACPAVRQTRCVAFT